MSTTEKKEGAANAPLHREGGGNIPPPLAEETSPATTEQSFFRGEPIEWLTVPTTKTVVTENAFGDSEASERPARKNHFIQYGGNQYKREAFYQMAFP